MTAALELHEAHININITNVYVISDLKSTECKYFLFVIHHNVKLDFEYQIFTNYIIFLIK